MASRNATSPAVLILAVSDNQDKSWPLLSSAAQHGHSVRLLQPPAGQKMRWPDKLLPKITLPLQFLRSHSHEPRQLVMLVDGFDVLITAPAAEIARRYHEASAGRVLFNAERWCFPPRHEYCRRLADSLNLQLNSTILPPNIN